MKNIKGLEIGQLVQTVHGKAEIIEIDGYYNIKIRFIDPEWITIARADHVRTGFVKNRFYPSVFGIGYPGEGPHTTGSNGVPTRIHQIWKNMLQRCYAPVSKDHLRNYSDVIVDQEWHNFQNFATWYVNQEELYTNNGNFKWHLDKDFIVPRNRIYAPDRCCIIPDKISVLLNDYRFARGKYPLGVQKRGKNFIAKCGIKGGYKSILFKTISEAHVAYWEMKFNVVRTLANEYKDYLPTIVRDRLLSFGWKEAIEYYGQDTILGVDTD